MTHRFLGLGPGSALLLCAAFAAGSPALGASLSRSVEVAATPEKVWAAIGPFCAIRDWHPAIGTCTESSGPPRLRTLVTTNGKATFVEQQTGRNDAAHSYSYTFRSSPLPVARYTATLTVVPKTKTTSVVTWSGTFTPEAGKEADATAAVGGIYEAGLDTIRSRFAQ